MAALSSGNHNLQELEEKSKKKPKYKQVRSQAYKRKRAAKRRKQSITRRKLLQSFLKNKGKKSKMYESVRNDSNLSTLVQQNSAGQGEAAFWKSKAISLQYENNMLYKHIEEIYSQMIDSKLCIEYKPPQTQDNFADENLEEDNEYCEEEEEYLEEQEAVVEDKRKTEEICENDECSKPPVQNKEERCKEMKLLYGNSYRKIMGMETVVQMQYEVTLDKEKINYWPVLPIKM